MLGLGNVVALAWLSLSAHRHELEVVAQTDSLTGLLNRGAFEEILRRELKNPASPGWRVALLLIDVDYFKQVNDAHGHLVGDDVLRRIGAALRLGIRPSDVLARFGGEEFVILLHDACLESAEEVAERLRGDIAALDDLPQRVSLTASFGVAASVLGESATEFLLRADEALYRSKREGRNLVRVDRGGRRMAVVQPAPAPG
jgi:diguanylate cyclase (GGDEF)-like protein